MVLQHLALQQRAVMHSDAEQAGLETLAELQQVGDRAAQHREIQRRDVPGVAGIAENLTAGDELAVNQQPRR